MLRNWIARIGALALLLVCGLHSVAQPVSPTHYGKAYRTEQDGWIVAHLEGKPHDVGFQYGYLLAAEIDDAQKTLQRMLEHDTNHPWIFFRETAERLFWKKIDREYQEELAGIADGLKARGYHYDTTDLLAQNGYIDIKDYYLPSLSSRTSGLPVSGAPTACSAFVATGSATADGKIVMGHNFWWDLLTGQRFKLILDVKPQKGYRFVMDTFPGFIHSGTDFAINEAGILICETTISGFTGFDENGTPEFMRMRKATQYSANLDDFARIMREDNNGGYANTWLIGDTKTNEIGKLELGLKNVIFSRCRDGAYTGANYPEDAKLIAEECVPGAENFSSGRRARWKKLMTENRGKLTDAKGRDFLADPLLAAGALNAKVVTAEMAKSLSFWARMNLQDGSAFSVTEFYEKQPSQKWMDPFLRDMSPHPWTRVVPAP